MTRVAVIGAGVSGLVAARELHRQAEVTVFEQADYAGGHTHTHTIDIAEQQFRVDSGFIVCNAKNYPNFTRMLGELKVPLKDTEMSFSAHNVATGLEYNAATVASLFCQKRNALKPSFWRMLTDIRRFYHQAPELLKTDDPGPSTGDYLRQGRYSDAFINDHLIPMASALWSSPPDQILAFPMRYMVQFFQHHQMLQITDRPQWQVVTGGSSSYVEALLERLSAAVELSCPVTQIRRTETSVELDTSNGVWRGDHVVFACHSNQALKLLASPTDSEREFLGAIDYQINETVLHTDETILPNRRQAWAAWNARVDPQSGNQCTVTYNMNILQQLEAPVTFCVTLNQTDLIAPDKILATMRYEHPVYTHEAVSAQARLGELNGIQRSHFCGAWHGWGFHEDGVVSGLKAAASVKAGLNA